MGWSLVFFALFRSEYLPRLQQTIEHYGWQNTWLILAGLVLVVMLPLWVLLIRNKPEQFGLEPDGTQLASDDTEAPPSFIEVNWTLAQAQRTSMLWIVAFGRMMMGGIGTALVFHQISIFSLVGHSALTAAQTFATIAIITAFVTPIIGYNINRIRPNYMLMIQLGLMIVTVTLSTLMRESWMLNIYALTFGVVMAIGGTFDNTVWADLFGRLHHGSIRGFVATIQIIGTAIGPVVFAWFFDQTGDYNLIVTLSVIALLIEIVLCLFVTLPEQPVSATSS